MAAQVLLVLSLSDRSPVRRRQPANQLRVTLVPTPAVDSAFGELQALADPTLFALPSGRGFAGAGWRRGTEFNYQSRDWTEPLHWLTNQATFPGPSQFSDAPADGRHAGLEKPGPRVTEATPAPLPMPGKSALRLEGAIARRALRSIPELLPIVHSNLLADTTVRVGVQSDGHVFSAAIARASGLKAADDRALEIARAARFEPVQKAAGTSGPPALSWGELIFRWHVVTGAGGPRS
jgi:TonB family protein